MLIICQKATTKKQQASVGWKSFNLKKSGKMQLIKTKSLCLLLFRAQTTHQKKIWQHKKLLFFN